MKKLILLLLLSFLIFSCKSKKAVHEKKVTTVTNKELVVTYKDTTIYVPKVSTTLSVPLSEFTNVNINDKVLKPKLFSNNNGRAKVSLEIKNNEVIATADCDSLALRAQIKSELRKEFSDKYEKDMSKVIKQNGVPFVSFLLFSIMILSFGLVAGFLIKTFNII